MEAPWRRKREISASVGVARVEQEARALIGDNTVTQRIPGDTSLSTEMMPGPPAGLDSRGCVGLCQ
eukprot:763941-Hanusia_phi.AAC.6